MSKLWWHVGKFIGAISDPFQGVRNNLVENEQVAEALAAWDNGDYVGCFDLHSEQAAKDAPVALNNLGVLYETGAGTHLDDEKALEMYRRSAELGLAEGQFNTASILVADIMADQKVLPRDEEVEAHTEAFKWLILAADQGHKQAKTGVKRISKHMTELQMAKATDLAKEFSTATPRKQKKRNNPWR